jgi:hypothetical protein
MLRTPRVRLLLVLLATALSLSAAQEKGMPQLSTGEIPSLRVDTTRYFAGKALYGYIDGGAELYLEYGFDRVTVQEVRLEGDPYWVEVFRMSDPQAALGIFSVSRGNCDAVDALTRTSCSSTHAFQFALSSYFVRIANSSGSPAARSGGLQLARILVERAQGDSIEIPAILAATGGREQSLVYVRGALGMQNGFDDWSPLVDGLEGFDAYIVNLQDSPAQAIAGDFRFKEEADLKKFVTAFSGTRKTSRIQQKGDRRVIVMESVAAADSMWARLLNMP